MFKKLALCIGVALGMAPPPWLVYGGEDSSPYQTPNHPATEPGEPVPEPTGEITLREVLAFAARGNPELAVYANEIRARAGSVRQAHLPPNPVLDALSSNLGNPALDDFDGPQTSVSLSQVLTLGGKRARAIEAAELDQTLAAWDYEAKRLDILTQTARAFIEVLRAQEEVRLADGLVQLAEQVVTAVSARVLAGKVSPVEETRARVALASVQIERARAMRDLELVRMRLAASWGSTAPRFESARGELDNVSPLPSLEALKQRLVHNPDLARWATEIAERHASIHLEKSRAVPDLTVSVGITEYHDTGDSAVIAGMSIPLPVFNRNQGNIQTAEERLTKALAARRAIGVGVNTALSDAYQRLAAAHTEVMTLKQAVLPGAQIAFDAVSEGYRLGKFGLLDVLDAQRTLFGVKAQYLRAAADYHKAGTEIERLLGERLETHTTH